MDIGTLRGYYSTDPDEDIDFITCANLYTWTEVPITDSTGTRNELQIHNKIGNYGTVTIKPISNTMVNGQYDCNSYFK